MTLLINFSFMTSNAVVQAIQNTIRERMEPFSPTQSQSFRKLSPVLVENKLLLLKKTHSDYEKSHDWHINHHFQVLIFSLLVLHTCESFPLTLQLKCHKALTSGIC